LGYSASAGACGPSGCGANLGNGATNCFVGKGSTYAFFNSCTPHVCTGSGGAQNDPESNTCDAWTGCGFNSISPNQYFGVCGTTAGTLCCAGSGNGTASFGVGNPTPFNLKNYWVDNGGNDSNTGASNSPFLTIAHANTVAVS